VTGSFSRCGYSPFSSAAFLSIAGFSSSLNSTLRRPLRRSVDTGVFLWISKAELIMRSYSQRDLSQLPLGILPSSDSQVGGRSLFRRGVNIFTSRVLCFVPPIITWDPKALPACKNRACHSRLLICFPPSGYASATPPCPSPFSSSVFPRPDGFFPFSELEPSTGSNPRSSSCFASFITAAHGVWSPLVCLPCRCPFPLFLKL